jgi:hypothetical protein
MQEKESKTNKHFWISMIKSGVRVFAGITLAYGSYSAAGCFFIVAEILGIIEEL